MELSFARWQYYDIYKDQISPPPGPYRTRLGGHKVIKDKLGHPSENIHQAVLANLFVLRVDSWRFAGDFYLWCLRNPLTGSVCVLNARVTLSSAATKHERPALTRINCSSVKIGQVNTLCVCFLTSLANMLCLYTHWTYMALINVFT